MPGSATPPSTSITSSADALGDAASLLSGSSLPTTAAGSGDAPAVDVPGASSIQPAAPASSRAPPIPASTNRSVSGMWRLVYRRRDGSRTASEVRRPGTRRRAPEAGQEGSEGALTVRLREASFPSNEVDSALVARRHHVHELARDLDHAPGRTPAQIRLDALARQGEALGLLG